MAFPTPVPGLVIRYSYLWASEHAHGQEEGVKDRPCAIILATADEAGSQIVTVLPISAYAAVQSLACCRNPGHHQTPPWAG